MMTIYEAAEWVVYAWQCATEEDARRHATHLHDERKRQAFVDRWREIDSIRREHSDAAAAAAIISSGHATMARRQPTTTGQWITAADILGDSLVPVLFGTGDAALLLGSVNGPWAPRPLDTETGVYRYDTRRARAWRQMMSDDVAGVVVAPDGEVVPIIIGWERAEP